MKRLALALAALLVAVSAAAQTTVKPLCYDGNGKAYPMPAGTDGIPLIQNAYPDWSMLWKYQTIVQNSLANTGAASDSSQAYPTLGANWLALRIHYGISPSVKAVLIALQVRGGYNAGVDSLSIAGWQNIEQRSSAIAFADDSLGTANEAHGPIGGAVMSNEIPVWLSNTAPSRDKWVILCKDGIYFRAPYTSIRWRVVTAYDVNMAAVTTGSTSAQMDLVGGR